MDGQEYLDRISTNNQPVNKSSGNRVISSKFFWVGLIGLVLLILIMIIGSMLGNKGGGERNKCFTLLVHLTNTSEIVAEYQSNVRSSELRSSSASLYGVLTNTNSELTKYATEKYKIKNTKDISKNILDKANEEKEQLNKELFEAKINGILDRTYAYKMSYEIMVIMAEENSLHDATKNDSLKDSLSKSYDSLKNLYDLFNNFSESR